MEKGFQEKGIFRVYASETEIAYIKEQYEAGE